MPTSVLRKLREAHPVVDLREHPPTACVSCLQEYTTPYCPWCGEKRPEDRQYTLGGFLKESYGAVSELDGKLIRSLRTLFNSPGELTARYMRGERAGWLPPFRLFLLMNVLFFLGADYFNIRMLDTTLSLQTRSQWYSNRVNPLVQERLLERRISKTAYARVFDPKTAAQARSLVIIMVPAFALAAALINARKRRPVLHHLTFSMHCMAALLGLEIAVYSLLITVAYSAFLLTGHGIVLGDKTFTSIFMAVIGTYFGMAQVRAYGDRPLVAALKGTLLGLAFIIVLQLYRPVLFFVTFHTT